MSHTRRLSAFTYLVPSHQTDLTPDGPATTRRATASATTDRTLPRAILKLHDTMSDFRFLHVLLAAEYAHVFFSPEEALRYQWEIGTELAALWSTALVPAQNAVSILRH